MDDEREQIEQLRTWWSDYGTYVIAGVVIGVAALFGTNWYQSNRLDAGLEASNAFSQLVDAVDAGEVETAESLANEIASEHSKSAYAAQAQLTIARLYMDLNRDEDAAAALGDVIDSPAAEAFKEVARLRLARIRLYQDRPNDVLELLGEPAGTGEAGAVAEGFSARYDEVRGDAYVALGRVDDAREAYRRALSEPARDATINQQLVQLKLLDLPVEPVAAANEPAGEPADADQAADDTAAEPGAPAADAAAPPEAAGEPTDAGEATDPAEAADDDAPADGVVPAADGTDESGDAEEGEE